METATVTLPLFPTIPEDVLQCWITISLQLDDATAWAGKGHEIAWCQHLLSHRDWLGTPIIINNQPQVRESKAFYEIQCPNMFIRFDQIYGRMAEWKLHNRLVFTSAPTLAAWRPPTENDMKREAAIWSEHFLGNLQWRIISVLLQPAAANSVKITVVAYIGAVIRDWGFNASIEYTVYGDGTVEISYFLQPRGHYPKHLPRLGIDMTLPSHFSAVDWFGCGPEESYADKRNSQKVGLYSRTPDTLHTEYEFPQENGNRAGTHWLQVTDTHGNGFSVTRVNESGHKGDEFDFTAQHYTASDIEAARHPTDLKRRDEVFLRLDAAHAGLGTERCGPATLEKYRVLCKDTRFTFSFEPVSQED